jgi:hypothetical protein
LAFGEVEIAARPGPVVPRHASISPAEIVRRGHVGEEVEALDVSEVTAGFEQSGRVDHQRCLAVLLLGLD